MIKEGSAKRKSDSYLVDNNSGGIFMFPCQHFDQYPIKYRIKLVHISFNW